MSDNLAGLKIGARAQAKDGELEGEEVDSWWNQEASTVVLR